MSPVQAERWLGCKRSSQGRALLKAAMKREREIGKLFVVRDGTGSGTRYRFSKAALRRHMPEYLEDRFTKTASRLEASVARLKEHIDAHIDERIENHPAVRNLQMQSNETIELLESLATQVERMAGVA
jgi:hypothetical protein